MREQGYSAYFFVGKNALPVPAQGRHESGDNCQEQQVLSCAEQIHSPMAKQVK
jgi:hypothetical protein